MSVSEQISAAVALNAALDELPALIERRKYLLRKLQQLESGTPDTPEIRRLWADYESVTERIRTIQDSV